MAMYNHKKINTTNITDNIKDLYLYNGNSCDNQIWVTTSPAVEMRRSYFGIYLDDETKFKLEILIKNLLMSKRKPYMIYGEIVKFIQENVQY